MTPLNKMAATPARVRLSILALPNDAMANSEAAKRAPPALVCDRSERKYRSLCHERAMIERPTSLRITDASSSKRTARKPRHPAAAPIDLCRSGGPSRLDPQGG